MSPFECDYGWQITIGARTFINYGCVILDAARVAIGDDVQVGPNVQLLTALHPLDPVERRLATETTAPGTIGRVLATSTSIGSPSSDSVWGTKP